MREMPLNVSPPQPNTLALEAILMDNLLVQGQISDSTLNRGRSLQHSSSLKAASSIVTPQLRNGTLLRMLCKFVVYNWVIGPPDNFIDITATTK